MSYNRYFLPDYPLESDVWDRLAVEKRKIAVWGMGNGADKLFDRLALYGVTPDCVFASDGFVRGHSYRGFEVISLSETERRLGDDFLILVSFASNRKDVIDLVRSVSESHELLIPDMPIAGEQYFDREFYNNNYLNIVHAYEALSDEVSRNAFAAIVNHKLFGSSEYLFGCYSEIDELYALLPEHISCAVDAGAYNGDTAKELLSMRPDTKRILALEPDAKNFKRLIKTIDLNSLDGIVEPMNCAAWSISGFTSFSRSGNRNSTVCATASYESKKDEVRLVRIDEITENKIDYIKYDVEGAELQALIGSEGVIETSHPALLVSVYHRSEDLFSLVNYIEKKYPFYRLYMRRTLCFPAWEIAIIAVPIENCADK